MVHTNIVHDRLLSGMCVAGSQHRDERVPLEAIAGKGLIMLEPSTARALRVSALGEADAVRGD